MDENNEICEIIPSQKEKSKINVRGRAIINFYNGSHYLKKFVEHNHSPQSSNAIVAEIIGQIKQKARITRDKPSQIIQDITSSILQ
ncbi:8539_t:CDS:2, partial [Funneliformis geosporum]